MRKEVRSHHALARLADESHGVVTAQQLRDLGYSPAAVARATAAGRLHRVHRGVYAVGRRELTPHGRCLAAVAACGRGAVLSHASAAWLWGMLALCPPVPEVTVPRRGDGRERIRVHRAATLAPEERNVAEGIPVTSVHRTLFDLAASGSRRLLGGAVERCERLGLLDLPALDALLRERRGQRGAPALREALEIYRDPVFSRARSERLFLDLVKQAGLPRPAINRFVAGFEVDAYWEAERFAVEIDGWEWHRDRASFERDPVKIERLKLSGIEAIRITARRIERRPREVARTLATLLARRRAELRR